MTGRAADAPRVRIAGRLRAGSFNRALQRAARALAPAGMEIAMFERLREIPPCDDDVDGAGEPAPVAELRRAIREADALLGRSSRNERLRATAAHDARSDFSPAC